MATTKRTPADATDNGTAADEQAQAVGAPDTGALAFLVADDSTLDIVQSGGILFFCDLPVIVDASNPFFEEIKANKLLKRA